MAYKRAIILSEYFADMRELCAYLRSKVTSDVEVILVEFDARQYSNSNWYRLKYHLIHKALRVGIWRIVRGLLKRQDIVVSSGASRFYRLICKKVIFVNHGWGTKRTPGKEEEADRRAMKSYRALLRNTDVVMCLSDFDSSYFMVSAMLNDVARPAFVPFGLPRNDYLVAHASDKVLRERVLRQLKIPSDWKTVLFAPTHRDGVGRDRQFVRVVLEELAMIDDWLGEQRIVLLFRPHYSENGIPGRLARLRNVRYVGFDAWNDQRELMISSSALITDYSSIFVDYLLLGKPIVFRVGDLEEYKKYRGLVIDYESAIQTPGKKIRSLAELPEIEWEKRGNIEKAKEWFYRYPDGKATERIGDYLLNEVRDIQGGESHPASLD